MVVAARIGFEDSDSLKKAADLYVSVNIHNDENKEKLASLKSLPDSCVASADALEAHREAFEKYDVFSPQMIDIIRKLRDYRDADLRERIKNNDEMLELVHKYWHCG